jgi:hypothetical protein
MFHLCAAGKEIERQIGIRVSSGLPEAHLLTGKFPNIALRARQPYIITLKLRLSVVTRFSSSQDTNVKRVVCL